MTEIEKSQEIQNSLEKPKFDLDTFKSIYYWANAKPDTQIKIFKDRKKIELSDIYDLKERVDKKLKTHKIETYIVSLNFILTEGNIKEYSSWEEFGRENWDTINHRIESINLTWDLTFSIPNFALPQRHTMKVRIGNAIPPKDMFQIIFTSDEPSELLESQAEGLVKVDFINQVLANELIYIVSNWQEGLIKTAEPKAMIRFLERREKYIHYSILYFIPLVFVLLSYIYHELLYKNFNHSEELNLLSIQKVAIIFIALYGFGVLLAKYLSSWFGNKIDKFKRENGIIISKGDRNYIEEVQRKNQSILNQISTRVIISIITTVILIGIKFLISNLISSF